MLTENGNFVGFLTKNYNLPTEIIELTESYIAVLGEPMTGDCRDGFFVEMTWDGEHEDRLLECFIYDEDNIEFLKVYLSSGQEKIVEDNSLIELRDWLDGV